MMILIKSIDIEVWKVSKEGLYVPTKKVDGKDVPKPKSDWNVDDYKKKATHCEVMNVIMCIVTPSEFKKILKCTITKEMWKKLEVTYGEID